MHICSSFNPLPRAAGKMQYNLLLEYCVIIDSHNFLLILYSTCMGFVHMQVPLGVITENEQEIEGMIEILTRLQQYVPKKESGDPVEIFFAGDQLTCERVRGAKRARMQSEDPQEQFATMIEMPGDWHALVTFYQVSLHVYTC